MQRQNGVVLKESASYFKSKTYTLLDVNDSLNDAVDNAYQSLYKHFGSRSGWSLKQINHLEISSAVYDPILGRTFFTTPTQIKRIRAVVNIDNVDDKCFCCVS